MITQRNGTNETGLAAKGTNPLGGKPNSAVHKMCAWNSCRIAKIVYQHYHYIIKKNVSQSPIIQKCIYCAYQAICAMSD